MKEFSWGHEFLRLNHELLELYRTATDAQDVISRQNEWLASAQERTDDSQTPASKLSRRKKKHWQEDSEEEEEEEEYQQDSERGDDPPQLSMAHGNTGELPPSDDEYYEEYDSDDEPELDKFGNIVEKSKGNDDHDEKTNDANQSDLLNAIENVHVV
jgi:pre-rRNA-processing protein TSR3